MSEEQRSNRPACAQCGGALPPDQERGPCPRCVERMPTMPMTPSAHDGGLPAAGPPPACRRRIGDYELLEELARGGMGVVFRARQISLQRIVAIKVISAGHLASPEEVKRFKAEAEAAASLDHPNIVPVYEVGEHEGLHYFSMRLIEGGSLASRKDELQVLGNSPAAGLPRAAARQRSARIVALLVKVARAVHFAHQRGILHRDIKPANILIDSQGEPYLTDFGLAKVLTGDSDLTRTLAILGTPHYMPPEQARGQGAELTTASDVYSLGVVLYELLTGRVPFRGDSLVETLREVTDAEPAPPRQYNPQIDRDLQTICIHCLQKNPARRYRSADALAEDLERWLQREPIQARRISRLERVAKWMRRRPALAAAVVTLHLVAAAGVSGILWAWRQAEWHRSRAENARADAVEKLRSSYIAQARALRLSGQPGRRFDALDALAKAAKIRPSPEMRDEAVACLPLIDVRLSASWQLDPGAGSAFFDPAVERWAAIDASGEITVRRAGDGAEECRFNPPPGSGGGGSPEFSPDGRYLAVSYRTGTLQVWDLATRQLMLSHPLRPMAFSPDLRWLATAEPEARIVLHGLEFGRPARTLATPAPCVQPQFDRSGRSVAAVLLPQATELVVIDVGNGTVRHRLRHSSAIRAYALHPDGRRVAISDEAGPAITIADLQAQSVLRRLEGHQGAPVCLLFGQAGKVLLSSGWDNRIRWWSLSDGREIFSTSGSGWISLSPDETRLGVSAWGRDRLARFELTAGSGLRVIQETLTPSEGGERVCFDRTGSVLAYTIGRQLKLCDPRDGRELMAVTDRGVGGVVADPAADRLGISSDHGWYWLPVRPGSAGQSAEVGPLQEATGAPGVWWQAFSADGRRILAQTGDRFRVLDAATFAELARAREPHPGLRYLSVSPDGRWVASGAWHNLTVKVWDGRTGALLRTIATEDMSNVLFSPDGRQLVIGGPDYRFLRTESWTETHRLGRPPSERFPPAMAFSRDGRILALCDSERSVALILPETGTKLVTLEPPNPWPVRTLSFNPDTTLLAVSGEGTAEFHVWDLDSVRQELRRIGLDWQ